MRGGWLLVHPKEPPSVPFTFTLKVNGCTPNPGFLPCLLASLLFLLSSHLPSTPHPQGRRAPRMLQSP